MKPFFNRYATPATLGLFAISAISGTALFLHTGQSLFHEMHEWLSMVLLLPFFLHIWKNWAAFAAYFRRRAMVVPLAVSVLVALVFAVPALSGAGPAHSPGQAVQLMTDARLVDLAPLLHTTPDALVSDLRRLGYQVDSADQTMRTVAARAGVAPSRLLFAAMPGH